MENLIPDSFISETRDKIRRIEERREWLLKHNFQEEARILQVKIGGMFQIYDFINEHNQLIENGQPF